MDYVRPLTSMIDVCLTLDPGFSTLEDLAFVDSASIVYLLGTACPTKDIEQIKQFSKSIIWFTYRKNWPSPIGGFGGPTSDRGWGCMIRCGQMLLAQSLITIHLGSDWRWESELARKEPFGEKYQTYRRLLKMFQDKRTSQFSIHQIAQFGVSEGKQLGEWLGPNTMAQVLKKLVVYDEWSRLVVHVAMDNVLISDDVRIMAAQQIPEHPNEAKKEKENNRNSNSRCWIRPLLLIIPLRLGLTAINPCYLNAVIEYFKLPQCVGILGGRPNHAVYFYGAAGKKLLYLDPHICQDFRDLDTTPPCDEREDAMVDASSNIDPTDGGCFSEPEFCGGAESSPSHQPGSSSLGLPSSPPSSELALSAMEFGFALRSTVSPSAPLMLPSSSASSSSVSSLNHQHNHHHPTTNTATISFPTSSSISKISSRSGDQSSAASVDELCGGDPAVDSFIESFADHDPGCTLKRKDGDGWTECCSSSADGITLKANEEWPKPATPADEAADYATNGNDALLTQSQESTFEQTSDASDVGAETSSTQFDDTSFHCPYILTMDFKSLDPSLALGFLARNMEEYEDLVHRLKTSVLPSSNPPLFEILDSRPKGWPKFAPFEAPFLQNDSLNISAEFDDLQYDSDEQFELLE